MCLCTFKTNAFFIETVMLSTVLASKYSLFRFYYWKAKFITFASYIVVFDNVCRNTDVLSWKIFKFSHFYTFKKSILKNLICCSIATSKMTTVILKYFGLNSSKHFHISTMGLKHNKGTSGKRFFVRGLFPALYIYAHKPLYRVRTFQTKWLL